MIKQGVIAITAMGFLCSASVAAAGERAVNASFPVGLASASAPAQQGLAPAKRRVAKRSELFGAIWVLPLVLVGVVGVGIAVASSGGDDSSPD
jgi:hypothetical protein